MIPSRPALEYLEEAVHLLRTAPARLITLYLTGTIPFLLGFLFFWADMSRNVQAENHLIESALIMTALYAWMKCWQSAASSELLAHCASAARPAWTWSRIRRLAYIQAAWQPTKLLALPLAALLALPFAWTCAFYHQLAMFGDGTVEPATAYRRAKELANQWPRQNFMALLLINAFGLFVFLNIYIMGALLPELLRMFTGLESSFSMSPSAFVLNSSFFAAALAVAHLCLNPLTLAFYVVRCFHAHSVRDGRDLLAVLGEQRNKEEGTRKNPVIAATLHTARVLLWAFSFLLVPCSSISAAEAATPPRVSAGEIDRSLKDVFERREFAWRMPRSLIEAKAEAPKGPVARFFERIGDFFSHWRKKIAGWYRDFRDWVRRITNSRPSPVSEPGSGWSLGAFSGAEIVLYVLLAATLAGAAFVGFRQWRSRRSAAKAIPGVAPAEPVVTDLRDEDVLASQLPETEWLRLARELAANGEYRLALRALFLGTLAGLASQGAISIARHKSNRDYFAELTRRARQHPDWPLAFGGCIQLFERCWYGEHAAGPELLAEFEQQQHRLAAPLNPPPVLPA